MKTEYMKAVLRGQSFALLKKQVQAVLSDAKVSPVPFAPTGVCGVTFVDDRVVTVLDTFGQEAEPGRIFLLYQRGDGLVAYSADSVDGFLMLDDDQIAEYERRGAELGMNPGLLRLGVG